LLIPVPEAEARVGGWRQRFDPSARKGVPAHVTVLYPYVPPERVGDSLLEDLRRLFEGIRPFEFTLRRPARFPGVLYLAPEPDRPFRQLTRAVVRRYPRYRPYGGAVADPVPHLTVADVQASGDVADLDLVERAMVQGMPIPARAREVWLMAGDGRWSVVERFPLGRTSRRRAPVR
jgi:2'-5' RNA ligase